MIGNAHEITTAFAASGMALSRVLSDMLDEQFKHHTVRRGCGFTQATRFLSTYVNQLRDPLVPADLNIFANWSQRETEAIARLAHSGGWTHGWRALDEAPSSLIETLPSSATLERLRQLPGQIRAVQAQLAHVESRLFVQLLEYIITGLGPQAPDVPGMPVKPEIGSCSQAEEFFLEIAHRRIRRNGGVNIIVGPFGKPLLVEKINLGESHSAIVVSPIRIHGVLIPVGSLCALRYRDDVAGIPTCHGHALPLSIIEQARFLRLTTLAVSPEARQRAFSVQVDEQIRSDFFSPLLTTIEHLQAFARDELAEQT